MAPRKTTPEPLLDQPSGGGAGAPCAVGAEPGPDPDVHPLADPLTPPLAPEKAAAPRATPPDNNGDGQPGGSDALPPYAVLLAPHAGVRAGAVVHGPRAAITALVDASAARMATAADIAIAGVHVHALPAQPDNASET